MHDTYSDEFGSLDFQRSQNGSGMSQRSQVHVTKYSTSSNDVILNNRLNGLSLS